MKNLDEKLNIPYHTKNDVSLMGRSENGQTARHGRNKEGTLSTCIFKND